MAMIHEKLYQSPNLDEINFKEYIEKLTMDLLYIYGGRGSNINRILDIEELKFNIDTAIPCGLIINELVTNSIKYAFPNNEGIITIKLHCKDDGIELTISDDGIGLPEEFDLEKNRYHRVKNSSKFGQSN